MRMETHRFSKAPLRRHRPLAALLGVTWVLSLAGCSTLWPAVAPQAAFYALNGMSAGQGAEPNLVPVPARAAALGAAGVLVVHVPTAGAGFDSAHIIYTQEPNRLQTFARHEWVDTPARMLAPLMVAALERGGGFRAVVLSPSVALGSLSLDLQLLRLQQEFGQVPSRVRLRMRAQLVDTTTLQVLATREFEQLVLSASEDAPGGVAAAQAAALQLAGELARWCAQAALRPG